VVTKTYDGLPEATALAKIADRATGAVWHRMGDCGYLDAEGCLWFCGRKAERVSTQLVTLHTEPCEQVFRTHPRVGRCALVGLGEPGYQRAAMIVEAAIEKSDEARAFARDLRALALGHEHTAPIKLYYFHPKFPVDVRHNAKIHRLTLAKWALTARGYESDPKR
jgi:acyl-coenzyme A synthetase/AMP-(fatty) acid ligase